jgi:DNA mismatch repair ATPase MutS
VRLFTSMRVEDSLQEGVSLFMAELKRLTALLSAAPPAGASPAGAPPAAEPPAGALPIVEPIAAAPPATADAAETLLYLVDEVLQGTNSEERRIAGRRLVRHLLRRRAIGAVTTHDLDLHRHPEVEAAARMVHFREVVAEAGPDQPALAFDYRLRPGLATTRNALRLAELTGLTDPDV